MARRSQWEHLKDEIVELFKEGKTPREIYPLYPDVPPKTIRNWHDFLIRPQFAHNSPSDSDQVETSELSGLRDSPSQKPSVPEDNQTKLIALEGAEKISDISLARRTLRAIARKSNAPENVRVQAALGLIRLAHTRATVPAHILDEVQVTGLKQEREKLKDLSAEELQQKYREIIRKKGNG